MHFIMEFFSLFSNSANYLENKYAEHPYLKLLKLLRGQWKKLLVLLRNGICNSFYIHFNINSLTSNYARDESHKTVSLLCTFVLSNRFKFRRACCVVLVFCPTYESLQVISSGIYFDHLLTWTAAIQLYQS